MFPKVKFVVSGVDDNILLMITLLEERNDNPLTLYNSPHPFVTQIINYDPCTFFAKYPPQSLSFYTQTITESEGLFTAVAKVKTKWQQMKPPVI